MTGAVPAPGIWNIANGLTALRLLAVPLFGWLLLHDDGRSPTWRWGAFAAFALAGLTDRLDGDIARRRGLVEALPQAQHELLQP